METINLMIVEDDTIIRESLQTFLGENPAIQLMLTCDSMEAFMEQSKLMEQQPDVMLLDIGLPGKSGLDGIVDIKARFPTLDIIMLTTFEESEMIFQALCSGACSYMSKRTPLTQIREAIFTVHRGGSYMSPSIARKIADHFMPKKAVTQTKKETLTERQQQIVSGLVDGLSYKLIASKLDISIDTVRDHIKKIYQLLEVNSKAEVITKSLKGEI
jgi:DNA-binding NarL/FixJ family response regulator